MKHNKPKNFLIILIILSLIILTGCTKSISEVKSQDYVDKTVTVKGTVENSIKFGELSGYTLKDENKDIIFVSSKELPEEGKTKKVSGTLKKSILGYYIED